MIAEAIQKILSLAEPHRETIHALEYSDKELKPVAPPKPTAVTVDTLAGLVKLVESGFNKSTYGELNRTFLWVKTFESVAWLDLHVSAYAQRQEHATTVPTRGITVFPFFNQFGSQEDFVIGLQSYFQHTPDLDYLLKLASHIDSTESVKLVDNSVTQEVTIKNGMAFKDTVELRNRLKLKPFRTFRELDQPESEFILRAKDGSKLALFEADGGAWKIDAMAKIAEWLANALKGSEIYGVSDLLIVR